MPLGEAQIVDALLYDGSGNQAVIDPKGLQLAAGPGHGIARGTVAGLTEVIGGYVATSATTIQAIRATTYTEPSSNAQMSLSSSSASDTSAGTGTRSVKITYYDSTMTGPLTETVTLNGTSNVNTVGTNLCYIEKIESVLVGSGGTNVGTITLHGAVAGGGSVVGTIAPSDGQTFWAHHYVAASKTCMVKRFILGSNGITGNAIIRVALPLTPNSFELQVGSQLIMITGQPQQIYDAEDFSVAGPARLTLYVKPSVLTASTTFATMILYEMLILLMGRFWRGVPHDRIFRYTPNPPKLERQPRDGGVDSDCRWGIRPLEQRLEYAVIAQLVFIEGRQLSFFGYLSLPWI